jgi:tetratricopeptide (TPR) repeat protein
MIADLPEDRETLVARGRDFERGGHWTKAIAAYERALEHSPGDVDATCRLAAAHATLGRVEGARAMLAVVQPVTGDAAAVLEARALIEEADGDTRAALTIRRELAGRAPDDPAAQAALVLALAREGRTAESQATLSEARRRWPDDRDLIRARVLAALEAADGPDLQPWRAIVSAREVDHAVLAGAVQSAVQKGRPKLAIRFLEDARVKDLREPLPQLIMALFEQPVGQPDKLLGQIVERLDTVKDSAWTRLFKPFVKSGRYDLARALVPALEACRGAGTPSFDALSDIAETLPDQARLPDDVARELASPTPMVVVRAERPVATVLVFTGNVGASQLIHARLSDKDLNLVHLRHFKPALYMLDGIPGVTRDYPAALERLREIAAEVDGPLFVIGQSMSGFSALRYAIDLEAEGVLGLNALTDISPGFIALDGRSPRTYVRMRAEIPEMTVNLGDLLRAASRRPRIWLYYNEGAELDVAHAKQLEDIRGVTLHPLAGQDAHNALFPMIREGLLESALEDLTGASVSG